ncbi:MAG: hypothetical protein ABSE64_07910 [Vulcanimicrobiaceae bacterium]|jgi:hypothetical protein
MLATVISLASSSVRTCASTSATMMYVLGLNHFSEQFPHPNNDGRAIERLQKFVRAFCIERAIQVLAEEWSDDAMQLWSVNSTYSEDVAADLGIAYLRCDANLTERAKLQIKSRQTIAEELGIEFGFTQLTLEETTLINVEAEESDVKREQYWLEKLIKHEAINKNILLLCGYKHVDRFVARVKREGYQAMAIAIQ